MPSFVGKRDSYALFVALEKMMYVRSETSMLETEAKLRSSELLKKHKDLAGYLEQHWFKCKDRWCLCYRVEYHGEVDTTNMSESLFNSLKAKLASAPNRKITVAFKFVFEKLTEIKRKAKLQRYKRSNHWKRVNPSLFKDLELIHEQTDGTRIDKWKDDLVGKADLLNQLCKSMKRVQLEVFVGSQEDNTDDDEDDDLLPRRLAVVEEEDVDL